MTYSNTYLAAIVADYQANVEPLLMTGRNPAGDEAAHAFVDRWPHEAVRAAIDALNVAYTIQHGSSYGSLAEAMSKLGR
ncbi:hypothetical protein OG818_30280 [Streptomyces virginiae]|uniref:hypothetical protein n=1 Tax=Streptomyces virginiae TaxID=1961 RepID=UPI00224FA554|nr:hypothetical protein [Streptomyces virginiae]MCX4720013.1 hypothetical protein [Streptomyces virginiae]